MNDEEKEQRGQEIVNQSLGIMKLADETGLEHKLNVFFTVSCIYAIEEDLTKEEFLTKGADLFDFLQRTRTSALRSTGQLQ